MIGRNDFSVFPPPLRTGCCALSLVALLVGACGSTEPTTDAELSVRAFAELVADSVMFGLELTNGTDTAIELRWSDCAEAPGAVLLVHAAGADASSAPLWDFAAWRGEMSCYGLINVDRVEARQQSTVARRVAVHAILGDSLQPGAYRLSVVPGFIEDIPRNPYPAGTFALE